MKEYKKLWIGLVVLIILSPLGIIIPAKFNAGSAWGEWGSDEIKSMIGFVPKGMKKLETIWSAKIPGYNFPGFNGWALSGLGYILSAIIGTFIIIFLCYLIGKILYSEASSGQVLKESKEDNS
ncbi:MAG: cobalamin biosynthesis protein [Actinobacteria bacterium]|nr:cobalamin biosynthesis protein [Actinomycetota bacterium]